MTPYTYKTTWSANSIRIDTAQHGVYVRIADDSNRFRAITLPAEERQAAAQAVAGDDYCVVPVEQTTWACARCKGAPQTHAEGGPNDECLYEPLLLINHAPSQPDRPEPADPASVRVGQVVEIEADDGSWMVRGEVAATTEHDPGRPISIGVPFSFGALWPNVTNATVRVLHAAEPEPDPAAVEALAQALYAAKAERIGLERDWSEIGNQDRLRHRTEALTLTRDHGVEVPTDD